MSARISASASRIRSQSWASELATGATGSASESSLPMNPRAAGRPAEASSRVATVASEPRIRPRRPGWPEIGAAAVAFGVLYLVAWQVLHHIPQDHAVAKGIAGYTLSALIGLDAFTAAIALRIRNLAAFGVRRVSWKWLLAGAGFGVVAFILSKVAALAYLSLSDDTRNIQAGHQAAATGGALTFVATLLLGAVATPIGEELASAACSPTPSAGTGPGSPSSAAPWSSPWPRVARVLFTRWTATPGHTDPGDRPPAAARRGELKVVTPCASVLLGYVPMLARQIITTAPAEEPGWRDFALPRLQGLRGPLLGTVILGLLWGGWHLPLFLTADWGGWPDASAKQPLIFVAGCVPLSLVMTWVFNRTRQSVPLVMLLHASINSTYTLTWPKLFPALEAAHLNYTVQLVATVAATLVLLVAPPRDRLGLPVGTPETPGDPIPGDSGQHQAAALVESSTDPERYDHP